MNSSQLVPENGDDISNKSFLSVTLSSLSSESDLEQSVSTTEEKSPATSVNVEDVSNLSADMECALICAMQ